MEPSSSISPVDECSDDVNDSKTVLAGLRVKRVWSVYGTTGMTLPTTNGHFAPKRNDQVIKVRRRKLNADGVNSSVVRNIRNFTVDDKTKCHLHTKEITMTEKNGERKCDKQKTGNDIIGITDDRKDKPKISKEQNVSDNRSSTEHNRMLIMRQKELATRRNYLRRQHQIRSGTLQRLQLEEMMKNKETLAYRLASRKSYLTLEIRLKQIHRDLLIAMDKCNQNKRGVGQRTADENSLTNAETDSNSKDDRGVCDEDNKLIQEERQSNAVDRLLAVYRRFIYLPVSPFLLLSNAETVFNIIRTTNWIKVDKLKDVQQEVLNKIKSMFLLLEHQDFIDVFIGKVIRHKKKHYAQLLEDDLICETSVQADEMKEDVPSQTRTDSSLAIVTDSCWHEIHGTNSSTGIGQRANSGDNNSEGGGSKDSAASIENEELDDDDEDLLEILHLATEDQTFSLIELLNHYDDDDEDNNVDHLDTVNEWQKESNARCTACQPSKDMDNDAGNCSSVENGGSDVSVLTSQDTQMKSIYSAENDNHKIATKSPATVIRQMVSEE